MTLKEHLTINGKTDSWLNLANQFGVTGTNKQKSDKVRRLYNGLQEPKSGIHIVLGCVHVPYHNKTIIAKIVNLIENNNVIGFHLIGDFLDVKSLSSHDEGRVQVTSLGKEYEQGNQILNLFDQVLPEQCEKTFIYGNHEARFFKFKSNIKNQSFADAVLSPHDALRLKERGYTIYTDWQEDYHQVGSYQLFHGIYCTTNTCKTHLDRVKSNCIFAHTHRCGNWFEDNKHSLNIGHLVDINNKDGFGYLSRIEKIKWQSGFAVISQDNKDFHADLVVVNNNSFFFGGQKY